MALQHLRSSTANKRPTPAGMSDGQLAINTASASPGLFFKDAAGSLIKVGPVHIGTTAPNATPASGGESGNSIGEQWLDTTGGGYVLKIWDGTAWRSESGEFVNVNGDTMTGNLVMDNASIVFEGATANDFETTLSAADPTADRSIVLPDQSGNVLVSGNASIVDADVSASAAIAGSKVNPDFGAQNVTTTGTSTAASFIPTSSTVPTNGLYLSGTNTVGIASNSTKRIEVDANGNVAVDTNTLYVDAVNNRVGLGTSSPQNLHTIQSASSGTAPELKIQNPVNSASSQSAANGLSGGRLLFGATGTYANAGQIEYRYSSVDASFGRNGSIVVSTLSTNTNSLVDAVTIDGAQRVGIGTATPGSTLTVQGNTEFRAFDGTTYGYADATNGLGGLRFSVFGSNSIQFATAGSERGRWDNSGRLLIGTSSSPNAGTGQYAKIVTQGYVGSDTGEGVISIQRGTAATSIVSGNALGALVYGDSAGNTFGSIYCYADANAGSGDYPGRLVFSTTADGASSPTERMRITQAGNIQFGVGSPTQPFFWFMSSDGSFPDLTAKHGLALNNGTSGAQVRSYANANTWEHFAFYNNTTTGGTKVGSISTTTSATAYNTSSDYRLKENVVPLTGAIDRVNQLQVHRFNFIADPGKTVDGFIAHEAQAVVPECVTGTKDEVDENGDPVYQGIDQSKLVPLLTAALQEAIAKIETLEAKVAALEAT